MVSFAYDNSDLINALKKRGKSIILGDFEAMGKHEKKISSLIAKKYD